jgi:hypothetical protein
MILCTENHRTVPHGGAMGWDGMAVRLWADAAADTADAAAAQAADAAAGGADAAADAADAAVAARQAQ